MDIKNVDDTTVHDEQQLAVNLDPEEIQDPMYNNAEVKQLMRKIDWRLIPILGAMYSVSVIDRANVCLLPLTWRIGSLSQQLNSLVV